MKEHISEATQAVTSFDTPLTQSTLIPPCRKIVLGSNSQWAPNVRMGVSTNYNKLCGIIGNITDVAAAVIQIGHLHLAVEGAT